MSLPAGVQGSPAPSSSYSEPNENEAGFEMTNGGRREGPDLTNESRSLSLVDLQDSSPNDGLDDSQWQRRTGLLPLSFQNPVYHMTTTSPRQQTDATPSDGSVGSQGNADDRNAMATKPAFLTQMSVGMGGGREGRGCRPCQAAAVERNTPDELCLSLRRSQVQQVDYTGLNSDTPAGGRGTE